MLMCMYVNQANQDIKFYSPTLLVYEVINGMRSAVVQKRQTLKKAEILINAFLKLDIGIKAIDEKGVLRLAIGKSITTYDASYLWLAKFMKIKLLTLDENLQRLSK